METIVLEVSKEEAEEVVHYYHENYVTLATQRSELDNGKVRITVSHFGKRE
jgi:hypothetical protein